MSDFNFLMLYAKLAGFKLLVSANRIGCEDEFSKTIHDRLLAGLDGAIHSTRCIMDLERQLVAADDLEETISCQLQGEEEMLVRRTIVLLDELEIDYDTYEYRVNGSEWRCALSADCDGVEIRYPAIASLSDAELGSLGAIIRDITWETGIPVSVARVVYD